MMKKKSSAKMKSLKSICAMLLAFLCIFSFAACGGNGDGDGDSTTAGTTGGGEGAAYSGPITLVSGGVPQISIVYQSAASTCILDTVDILQREVKDICGADMKSVSDALHERADDSFEILIGTTKYEASTEALSALGENSYSVTVSGKKIILSASNVYLYPEAAKQLIAALKLEDGTVTLAQNYSFKSESYEALSLGADGKSDYTLVYESENEEAQAQAAEIKTAFRDIGITIDIIDDLDEADDKEIIIGDADRDLAIDGGHYYKNAWIGRDDDGNIAITGDIVCGAKVFMDYIYTLGSGGGNIALLENMFGNFAPEGYGNAPQYEGSGEVELFDSFEASKSYYVIVHGASSGDYEEYVDTLKLAEFECYDEKTINGNDFATYTDGYNIVTLSRVRYTDPDTQDKYAGAAGLGTVSYMSIAIDCVENSALPAREKNAGKITNVQLTTIDTECGYVIRLEDGRFVVIDGGFGENARIVYDIIKSQNKLSGNPVIAAWLITHGHSDHIGAILEFTKSYSKKATIESVIHNLPAFSLYDGKNNLEMDVANQKAVAAALKTVSENLYKQMASYYPSADVIVAHAGQKFELPGMTIDILFTSENLYRKQMRDTNMSSVIYSLTGSAGRMIILGDQQESGCAILNAIYGKTLKCDIVQVAHHGYNGGDTDMYASMDAKYAIWSNSYEVVTGTSSGDTSGEVNEETAGVKLYDTTANPRNFFDYKSVDANLIPKISDKNPIILTDTMTASQIKALDAGLPK